MKKKALVLFVLTFLLSSIIRLYSLTTLPEGFDQTEASFAYNAYAVWQTGRDEYGKLFPLILVSFGDYKLAGYMYWQIPFIALLGLSEFSARLSTVVAGIISLLLIYFCVYETLRSRRVALLTFFFAGIAPWHIILSRMAYDPMIAFLFYLASVALYIRWYRRGGILVLLGSALSLCFSIMTYYAVWVIFPFTILYYLFFLYKRLGRKPSLIPAIFIVCLPFVMVGVLFFLTKGERLYQDSTYQVHARPLLQEQIMQDQQHFPLFITRTFHNKVLFYPQILLQNLSNNLSFDFLFLRGDKMDRRFYVPYHGVLYLWTAPFLFVGMLSFWKHFARWKNVLILGAIMFIFLGSSFSEFGSEMERTLFALPPFCLLISYGVMKSYEAVKRYPFSSFLLWCLVTMLSLNVAYFTHQYFWHANVHQPWGRDYGVREMVSKVRSLEKGYTNVVIPDSAYIFFYFYNQVDPKVAWAESALRLDKKNFVGLRLRAKVGNYLTMSTECPAAGKLHVLYVCRGTKIPLNSRVVHHIRYRDGQPAFILLEFLPTESISEPPENVQFMTRYGIIDETDEQYWKEESQL